MNIFKLSCLLALVWLTGCASAPSVNSHSNPPSQAHAKTIDSDPLTLHSARELVPNPSTAQANFAKRAPMAVYDEYAPLADIAAQPITPRTVTSTVAPTDLWDRIRRGYGMPDLTHALVDDREQWYSARPDYIFRMTERSKKYLFHIVEELELRNMPTELALLPFIESAFNPQAVSSAKAAGIWQFMPATGKYFDLKQNAFRDDRRDVLASTRAALDYLQKLHNMFGDWHLALAAYNWGEGSVGRAIAKNKRAGLPTGYLDLNMPMETRFYVPKLQAVKNIVAQPEVFNSRLPVIENHPYFQSVTIRRDIDVVLAAKLAEVPLADFKALNPSIINRPVIMAAGTPQILLPWDNAEVFQSNLEAYSGGRLASWTVWQAPSTMHPSEAARRVGMSESELRSVNAIPPKVVIRAGSSLLVPRNSHIATDVSEKIADNGQLSLAPEVVLKRSVVRAGKKDSVRSLARKYKVSPDQLAQWNKVPVSANFKRSQQVVLFLPYRVAKAKAQRPTQRLAANKKSGSAKGAKRKTSVVAAKNTKGSKNTKVSKGTKAQTTKLAKH